MAIPTLALRAPASVLAQYTHSTFGSPMLAAGIIAVVTSESTGSMPLCFDVGLLASVSIELHSQFVHLASVRLIHARRMPTTASCLCWDCGLWPDHRIGGHRSG